MRAVGTLSVVNVYNWLLGFVAVVGGQGPVGGIGAAGRGLLVGSGRRGGCIDG